MRSNAASPAEYIRSLPKEREQAISKLRGVIRKNLPKGFAEEMQYGMIGYVVPHSIYPDGYHCDSKQPLPFMCIASQKHYIAIYHMGVYLDKVLLKWFITEFKKQSKSKLDMGKSCIRFKKPDQIPFKLIGELASKITVKKWIAMYEKEVKR